LPADYAAFVQMLLAGGRSNSGETVLKPETVALMGQNHIAPLEAGVIKIAMPICRTMWISSPDSARVGA
jgi:hypothetical protein